MSRANEPAYPILERIAELPKFQRLAGLTIREHFAALAMQGILASWPSNERALDVRATAETAVKHADCLIAELARSQP